jgi:tetratricopeptide (TPR) repeat protein
MALVREGHALLAKGQVVAGEGKLDEAERIFTALRNAGDRGEQVALGLALSKFTHYTAWGVAGSPGSKANDLPEAAQLMQPFVDAGTASRQTRLVYADVLNYSSHRQIDKKEAVALCERARKILVGLGATDLTDLSAASVYADTADSESRHALQLGNVEDAVRLSAEVYEISEKVLAQRPGDLRSMANRALASGFLVGLSARKYDFASALEESERAMQAAESYVAFNPSNMGSWDYPIRAFGQKARMQFELGQVDASVATGLAGLELQHDPRLPSSLLPQLGQILDALVLLHVRIGDEGGASRLWPLAERSLQEWIAPLPPQDPARLMAPLFEKATRIEMDLMRGHDAEAYRAAVATLAEVEGIQIAADSQADRERQFLMRRVLTSAGYAALQTDRPDEAVKYFERRTAIPALGTETPDPRVQQSRYGALVAHARVKQGRAQEALVQLQGALAFYRDASSRGAKGVTFTSDYAYALYVDALARAPGDTQRTRSLTEARRLLEKLSPEAQRLVDIRRLSGWIAAAGSGAGD